MEANLNPSLILYSHRTDRLSLTVNDGSNKKKIFSLSKFNKLCDMKHGTLKYLFAVMKYFNANYLNSYHKTDFRRPGRHKVER